MSRIPSELRYTSTHEWARLEGDNEVVIGITHYAQARLGDMVFVDLPEEGEQLLEGEETGIVESVSCASDVYSPVSGEVIAINEDLEHSPELVNQDPYGAGWLFRVRLSDADEYESLMDAESYQQVLYCEED